MPTITVLPPAVKTADIEAGLPYRKFTDLVEFFYRDACTRDSALVLINTIPELYGKEQTKDVALAWAVCLANNATCEAIQKMAERFTDEMSIPRCIRCSRAMIPDQQAWHQEYDCTILASRVIELPLQR
jgi:hypothetical protein